MFGRFGIRARRACTAIALALAAACSPIRAQSDAATFDGERAWKHLEKQVELGPRPSASPANESLRAYIAHELESYGLAPIRETFTCAEAPTGPLSVTNVYADVAPSGGDRASSPIVVVCTHFDTKRMSFPFLGANDGGSGTAVLLELARHLAARPSSQITWRVVFLDGEEALRAKWADPDNRYGSRRHVEAFVKRGEAKRVKACVLLDMIGDRDLNVLRETNSDSRLFAIVRDAAKSLGLEKHFSAPAQPIEDDHLSFMAAGVPSVDLIDFDYGPDGAYWHSKDDTLEHCSRDSLVVVGRVLIEALPALEAFAKR
jgi:hypothetical protein